MFQALIPVTAGSFAAGGFFAIIRRPCFALITGFPGLLGTEGTFGKSGTAHLDEPLQSNPETATPAAAFGTIASGVKAVKVPLAVTIVTAGNI
jgi:hypothetical protein